MNLTAFFYDFLWAGKPPKFRKEILEAEIKDGGMKLHNLSVFDAALKLGWLKRFLKSNSKWTIFPKDFELEGVFYYGADFIERIEAMTTNPFWIDVLTALNSLWKNSIIFEKHVIRETPLWFNPIFRLYSWEGNGKTVVFWWYQILLTIWQSLFL